MTALALFPRAPVRFFALLAGLSLFLTLGRYISGYEWLYRYVPGWSFFRAPARALVLWTFAVAVLSGWGIEAVGRSLLSRSQESNADHSKSETGLSKEDRTRLHRVLWWLTAANALALLLVVVFSWRAWGNGIFWKLVTGATLFRGSPDEHFARPPQQGLDPEFLEHSFAVSQQSLMRFVGLLTLSVAWLGMILWWRRAAEKRRIEPAQEEESSPDASRTPQSRQKSQMGGRRNRGHPLPQRDALNAILFPLGCSFHKQGSVYLVQLMPPAPPPSPLTVRVENGRLTLNANNADVRTTLSEIVRQAGVNIVPDATVTGSVTLNLTNAPLEQALERGAFHLRW